MAEDCCKPIPTASPVTVMNMGAAPPDGGAMAVPTIGRIASPTRAGAAGLIALMALGGLGGCGNIEPWVKPYERQALADPIMQLDRHPVSTAYMHHVYEAREGARGAMGGSGGGCGCN